MPETNPEQEEVNESVKPVKVPSLEDRVSVLESRVSKIESGSWSGSDKPSDASIGPVARNQEGHPLPVKVPPVNENKREDV